MWSGLVSSASRDLVQSRVIRALSCYINTSCVQSRKTSYNLVNAKFQTGLVKPHEINFRWTATYLDVCGKERRRTPLALGAFGSPL